MLEALNHQCDCCGTEEGTINFAGEDAKEEIDSLDNLINLNDRQLKFIIRAWDELNAIFDCAYKIVENYEFT